jgi:hypothetical protein
VTRDEAQILALELVKELRREGSLAIAGASVFDPGPVTTGCTCDGKCGCNERCGCQDKQGCSCNERCPCDAKAAPAKAAWVINPDPTTSRAYVALDVAGSADDVVRALRTIRAGLRAQGLSDGAHEVSDE